MDSRDGNFLDPGRPRPPGSPWIVVGFVLGLLALSPAAVLYFWFFAPIVPLLLAGVARIFSGRVKALYSVAEGLVGATLFGIAAVVVFFVGLSTLNH